MLHNFGKSKPMLTCHPYLVPLVVRPGGGIHGPANVLGLGQWTWTGLWRILDFWKPDDLHCGFAQL